MTDKARARVTFHAGRRIVSEGDELDPNDPVIKGREALFVMPEKPAKKAAPRKASAAKKAAPRKASAAKKAAPRKASAAKKAAPRKASAAKKAASEKDD